MSSQITCTVQNDSLKHLKTSGKLLKYRELKIAGENEILVKGKTLFGGYVKQIIQKVRIYTNMSMKKAGLQQMIWDLWMMKDTFMFMAEKT